MILKDWAIKIDKLIRLEVIEYSTYIFTGGDNKDAIEIRYEDKNV